MRHCLLVLMVSAVLTPPAILAQTNPEPEYKPFGPTTAVALAVANTVIPIGVGAKLLHDENAVGLGFVLLAWGWVAGPAPFNLYFGDKRGAYIGMGVRAGAVLAAAAAVSGGSWDEDGSAGTEIALLGLFAVSAVTAAFNLRDLPSAVRSHQLQGASVTLVPSPYGTSVGFSYRF